MKILFIKIGDNMIYFDCFEVKPIKAPDVSCAFIKSFSNFFSIRFYLPNLQRI